MRPPALHQQRIASYLIVRRNLHTISSEFHSKLTKKMRTYRLLKQSWGPEDYLFATMDAKNRLAMTKLRLSNHNLSIEKGRHQDVPLTNRSCPFQNI